MTPAVRGVDDWAAMRFAAWSTGEALARMRWAAARGSDIGRSGNSGRLTGCGGGGGRCGGGWCRGAVIRGGTVGLSLGAQEGCRAAGGCWALALPFSLSDCESLLLGLDGRGHGMHRPRRHSAAMRTRCSPLLTSTRPLAL